jgi:hypothetical protein
VVYDRLERLGVKEDHPMSALSSYNPLKTLWIPGAEITEPSGIIVIVGPNSSGKTLLLRDILNYLLTGTPKFIVCQGIKPQRPVDYQPFIDELIERHYLQELPDHPGQFRTYVPFMGEKSQNRQQARHQINFRLLEKAFSEFVAVRNGENPVWFSTIGITLVAPLFLDIRRHICNRTKSFNYKIETPDDPLQGLHLNSEAQERLAEETGNVFGNAVWLDISEHNVLQLRVSGSLTRPPHGQTNNPLEARNFIAIEDEGDGYRSYVGTCLSLLMGIRSISLIDEPELCLHPPQALHIGRFIGKYAKPEHVTFVATHSSQVLRGILETGKRITIVRLTRRDKQFSGRLIAEEIVSEVLRNPRARSEPILDGIFSKAVMLVESEGDREEYQAAAEALPDYPAREVHFVPVGGTGFAEALRFYRTLGIPVAVIADLDAVCDTDKIVALARLIDPGERELIESLRAVVQKIKSLSPPITEEAAREALRALSEEFWVWKQGGDNILRRRLSELVNQLRRIQKVKDGGIEAYRDHPDIHANLTEVVEGFRRLGLFFVPVGELEDWVPELMKDYPKGSVSKTERAAIAAEKIRVAGVREGDIWEFVRGVCDYLRRDDG